MVEENNKLHQVPINDYWSINVDNDNLFLVIVHIC
ncbi:hypothetical protein RT0184 [Rickettsia typhi str. Wilmington]|uniref:Uncharacterized protein n=1 Tax=Rickettsia typhi (strain ATCC VR-144 / Wilmington) TaxID=257363 RepID=Q68XH4_RICTY|nr:hypothetical protein RT0184 [Rickettsia typhi str. Wilmington]